MKIAYVTLQGRGRTDELICAVAERLAAKGLRLAGTVQSNHDRPDRKKCDMDLRVLPDGPTVRISEDRGELARGCILDSGALEQTVLEVERRLDGADILIVNKFGKREAEGKGLAPVVAEALHRDMPVLVGVNGLNLAAFLAFAERTQRASRPAPTPSLNGVFPQSSVRRRNGSHQQAGARLLALLRNTCSFPGSRARNFTPDPA